MVDADLIVVPADHSGGTHTSRTMMLAELDSLLAATPESADAAVLKAAVIDQNVTGKKTLSGRNRTYRYLRELYALDPSHLSYRALRDLWNVDPMARPLLALLSALARDPALRATAPVILESPEGTHIAADDLSAAVRTAYPHSYSESIAAKIGRNTASTWTQSGHLAGRTNKVRAKAAPTPAAVAYALLLGHTEGLRGLPLFDTLWCKVLDRPRDVLVEQAQRASQRGLIDLKHGGGVIEVGFKMLLRPYEEAPGE